MGVGVLVGVGVRVRVGVGVEVMVGVGVTVGATAQEPTTYFPTHADRIQSSVLQVSPIFWHIF